ncbi:MAG: hypothetical protein ACE5G2_11475 [Candidatus Krumholzibacteriia bacterium]
MRSTADIYRDILARTTARYLSVRPHGIHIDKASPPLRALCVQILEHGAARTLYRKRKPVCRSLDGLHPIHDSELRCSRCDQRPFCTPQVRVHLVYDHRPYRLLLAFTSAKNFLFYCTHLRQQHRALDQVVTRIRVLNRGTWGELRFDAANVTEQHPQR